MALMLRMNANISLQRSRATRNQDAATRSRQGQVIDLDPTDGLPVQKYALMKVTLNQDASTDATTTNTKSTNSAEWAAQFKTPQFPWSEPPLPSFQKELPIWNQELIRRARAGNTNAKLSVWDRKTNSWMSAAEAEKKATPLKSLHLNNLEQSVETNGKLPNGDADSQKSADDSDAADSSNESNKSADEDEEDADEGAPFKTSSTKRRKLANRLNGPDETRLIEVKRWVQLPSTIADRTPDRNFLAPRRPGMPPLYNPEYAQKVFGQYHSSSLIGGTPGYDLGEGGGLSSATAAIGGGPDANAGTSTPSRKNIPPRRKKKKLGGPGRKPKNWHAQQQAAQVDGAADAKAALMGTGQAVAGATMEGVQATGEATGDASVKHEQGAEAEGEGEGDGDGDDNNDSGSEAEGSEEGEIDETGGAEKPYEPREASPVPPGIRGGNITTAAMEELHTIPAPTMTSKTETSAGVPGFVVTDTEMGEVEKPEIEAQSTTAAIQPASNTTVPLPSAHKSTTLPTDPISIPGLGAENPADAEEQQIITENAEAITTTDTTAAPDPAAEQISGVSEAIVEAVGMSRAEKGEGQEVKEDRVREAAGRVESVVKEGLDKEGGEGEMEMDLLGAMDEAIDRGMSEGR